MASDVGDIHEDDLEVYGGHAASAAAISTTRIASYSFEVCDSLLNIGPCGQVAMGEPAFLSEELSKGTKADPDVELVTTSGHGKNGALCVLQQSVRPQVVTTFELPGCKDMWTITGGGSEKAADNGAAIVNGHAFLILSRYAYYCSWQLSRTRFGTRPRRTGLLFPAGPTLRWSCRRARRSTSWTSPGSARPAPRCCAETWEGGDTWCR